ncbi:hypothetical protein GCM10025760_16950 [Microbacterium yannicii]|uniref:DUF2510 domain-containing protein n=1 Tax=Microbacterium yannicii TaxID=671622 RepID=A0ABP9M7P9_9MICO|nr:DUF2510 domain-containing protein [Microbacterium yannicii]MCO5955127.1 DUF2510 domain-containing protein [Microbacterium yannicii]
MSEQAPAGWYSDGQGNERYWDGSGWTEEVRVLGTSEPVTVGAGEKKGAFSKLGSAVRKAAADRQSAKDEIAREQAEYAAAAGRLITSGVFGTSTIEIYEHGYVRVAAGTEDFVQPAEIKKTTPFEKLGSIKFTESDEEKAAAAPSAPSVLAGTVGTAVTSIMSGGKSLMKGTVPGLAVAGVTHLAGTGARRSILMVVTDKAIHTLSNQYKNSIGIKTSNKGHSDVGRALQSAGNAVLGMSEPATTSSTQAVDRVGASQGPTVPSLSDRLRELSSLHREGILSDEEFAESKARVLAGL